MPIPGNIKFCCGALPSINNKKINALKPDAEGFYEVTVAAIGTPTRAGVIYEPNSLIAAMNNPTSPFNIMLKDGNLTGEYGHPVINGKEDIPRLMRIDEQNVSHYFKKIWVDENSMMVDGMETYPVKALIKPTGPKGKILEQQLQDPTLNNAFSIRSLVQPMNVQGEYEYRKVLAVVTFDAVMAPGYTVASKRYTAGQEALVDTNVDQLIKFVDVTTGMESIMISTDQLNKIARDITDGITVDNKNFASAGNGCFKSGDEVITGLSMFYRK